jgi:hypothetical protein
MSEKKSDVEPQGPATPTVSTHTPDSTPEEKPQYPTGSRLWLIMLSLYITMFLVSLVNLPPLHYVLSFLKPPPEINIHN